MPDVITLDEAKAHLSITTNMRDADLNDKLQAATQIVIDYLTRRDTVWNATMDAWTPDTVPKSVRAAILIQFGELTRALGDEPLLETRSRPGALSPVVEALLARYRDPVLS